METMLTILFFTIFAVIPLILAKKRRKDRGKTLRGWRSLGNSILKQHSHSLFPWNLYFDGTFDFILVRKLKEKPISMRGSGGSPPTPCFKVSRVDGEFEYTLRYIPLKEYQNRHEGDLLHYGLIRNSLRDDIYFVTRETNEKMALIKLIIKSWIMILSVIIMFLIPLYFVIFFISKITN